MLCSATSCLPLCFLWLSSWSTLLALLELKGGMQLFAVGATAVGASTLQAPLEEGTGKHFSEAPQAADEPAAQVEIWIGWHDSAVLHNKQRKITPQSRPF